MLMYMKLEVCTAGEEEEEEEALPCQSLIDSNYYSTVMYSNCSNYSTFALTTLGIPVNIPQS